MRWARRDDVERFDTILGTKAVRRGVMKRIAATAAKES